MPAQRKKLLITRDLPDKVIAAAQEAFDVTVRRAADLPGRDVLARALADYDAILPTLGDAFTADLFDGPVRCGILANFGVGYNHIDAAAARAVGVEVTNTPGAVTDATADIAITLMLMTCRRAGEGERMVRAGNWPGWRPTQLLGMHVTGKTIGIIGMGRIGKAIAQRAHFGFGMKVVFFNRSTVEGLPYDAQQLGSVSEVMGVADVVALAVPGSAETHHLVDAPALAVMQPHAVLVNISRGDVVDETALIAALAEGRLAGAGLDVYEHEPHVPPALIGMENVTLLPHLGTSALEVREEMGMMALANLLAWSRGEAVPNPV